MTAEPEEGADILQKASAGGKEFYLCEYENAVPIGSAYQTYMTEKDFLQVPKELRAAVMLECLIVPEEKEEEAALTMEKFDGSFEEKISVEKLSEEYLDQLVSERVENGIQSLEKDPEGFTAVLNTDGEGYAFFSVPHDDGFRAEVNGERVEIMETNGMMAVPVEKGRNQIRFTYRNEDFLMGVLCSAVGVVLFGIYVGSFRKKRDGAGE